MVAVRNVIGMLVAALSLSLGFMVATAPHALATTGGYPYANATACGPDSWCIGGSDISPYGYGYRNCTDYVAWKIRQVLGVTLPKT